MSLIRKHVAVLQAWACLDLVSVSVDEILRSFGRYNSGWGSSQFDIGVICNTCQITSEFGAAVELRDCMVNLVVYSVAGVNVYCLADEMKTTSCLC